jgi:hypothetical protein
MRTIAILLLACGLSLAQGPNAIRKAAGVAKKGKLPGRVGPKGAKAAKTQLDRLSAMSPEERSNALSHLPPERRAQAERRLDQYNKLSPAERDRLFKAAEGMTPERRRAIQQGWRSFEGLPVDRKPVVRRELVRLRNLPPEARDERVASEEFKSRFNADERRLLEDLGRALGPVEKAPVE